MIGLLKACGAEDSVHRPIIMLKELNAYERQCISALQSHPLFRKTADLSWDELIVVLLQRRYLSLLIINVFEFVIDALESEMLRATVRLILHEEYPRNTRGTPLPSPRDLLFRDLRHLGASRLQILTTAESALTREVRLESLAALESCLSLPHGELALLCVLRFGAEVLVSVEYGCLWPRLSERFAHGIAGEAQRSQFF
ncbi:hypothetical protein NZK33_16975 [Cyanobium sp. FGCU-6]|nr:hypothetical protein [Cyanobium sp. FGCU6]